MVPKVTIIHHNIISSNLGPKIYIPNARYAFLVTLYV